MSRRVQTQRVTKMDVDRLNWEGIVKVQLRLTSAKRTRSKALNEGHDPSMAVLIHSEDRSIFHHDFLTEELKQWFGHDVKFFAQAELRGTIIHLRHKVGWQNW